MKLKKLNIPSMTQTKPFITYVEEQTKLYHLSYFYHFVILDLFVSKLDLEMPDEFNNIPLIDFVNISYPDDLSFYEAIENSDYKSRIERHKELTPTLFQMVYARFVDIYLVYISRLLFQIFSEKPETLKSRGTVDIKTILDYNDINQLIEYLAEKRVVDFAYKSINDLSKELSAQLGFNIFQDDDNKNKISRIIEIRNLIVHNNGYVNSRALSKCPHLGFNEGDDILISLTLLLESQKTLFDSATHIEKSAIDKFSLATIKREKDS